MNAAASELDRLRGKLAAVVAQRQVNGLPAPQAADSTDAVATRAVVAVDPALRPLFPHGGPPRGSVMALSGARTIALSLIATVTAAGGYVAIVGEPGLNVRAAVDMGAVLSRVSAVPEPGTDPIEVAAVLLDGMDMVICGLAGTAVPPARARVITARARNRGALLVVLAGHWPGAHTTLTATVAGCYGAPSQRLTSGYGRIGGVELTATARGRGLPERTIRLRSTTHAGGTRLAAAHSPQRLEVAN